MPVSVEVSMNDTRIALRKVLDDERLCFRVTLPQRQQVISRKPTQDSIDITTLPSRSWRCHTEDQSHEHEQSAQSPHAYHLLHLQSHGCLLYTSDAADE